MHFTINQCEKNNIKMSWCLVVGYPGETEGDFQETLDLLTRYAYLKKNNSLQF